MQAVRDLALQVESVRDLTAGRSPVTFQRTPTAGWKEPPTAWQALESVWPALARLHPQGGGIATMFTTIDHPGSWHVWVTEDRRHVGYEIDRGVLHGPVHGTPTAPPVYDPTPLFRLPRKSWARLIDSDAAIRNADEAGGTRLRKSGGRLCSLMLRRVRHGWVWHVRYERWGTPYWDNLRVYVGVRNGEIVDNESSRSLWL